MLAYFMGCHMRNTPPKQAENVASGSVTPSSVPATLAVYPEMKWYIACSLVRRDTGGSTPNASQHSRTRLRGWGPTQGMRALSMWWMGYDARVFSVTAFESKSTVRVCSSNTTFSSTAPKRMAFQISGSWLALSPMHLA